MRMTGSGSRRGSYKEVITSYRSGRTKESDLEMIDLWLSGLWVPAG